MAAFRPTVPKPRHPPVLPDLSPSVPTSSHGRWRSVPTSLLHMKAEISTGGQKLLNVTAGSARTSQAWFPGSLVSAASLMQVEERRTVSPAGCEYQSEGRDAHQSFIIHNNNIKYLSKSTFSYLLFSPKILLSDNSAHSSAFYKDSVVSGVVSTVQCAPLLPTSLHATLFHGVPSL